MLSHIQHTSGLAVSPGCNTVKIAKSFDTKWLTAITAKKRKKRSTKATLERKD